MNTRAGLSMTAAVSFALTCGVLLWNRREIPHPPLEEMADALDPASARLPPTAPATAAANVATAAPVMASQEMPIQLTMRALPASTTFFGAVVNGTMGSLMIDVAVFSPLTHQNQTGQLRIEAGTRAKFGVDDGLVIQAGDRVTLHSAGYQDIITQLPTPELDPGTEARPTP